MKKLLIFDMDGVIFDSAALAANYLKEVFPNITEDQQRKLLDGNFHEELAKLKLLHPVKEETEEEKDARRRKYAKDKLAAPIYAGMKELLTQLNEDGHIITLNTSATAKNCMPLFDRENLLHLFDFIATSETSKSKVEKFAIIKDMYKTDNENMLFITDTLGDVREANIAGIPTVAVTWGAHGKDYFYQEENKNLLGVVESVEELEKFIVNH